MWESPACEWEDELMLREGSPQPEVHPKKEKLQKGSQRGRGAPQGERGWGMRTATGRGFKEAKLTESRDVSRVFGD